MLQTINDIEVFVVDFDTMPTLPITWNTLEEKPYALALEDAIKTGKISEPGKYGIRITENLPHGWIYNIYTITE